MTCADYRLAISARLDGELGAHDALPCAAHARGCTDCAQWLAGARRLRELTRAAAGPSEQRSQLLVNAVLDALGGTSVAHEGS
ncbi:zf-HC2 domain-containing protein [Kitasatospora sp. NBC_01250]|uniref:anti-sigma factor family protein n=1 Tax=unclassified Kitasatospora TaxID=2633591 RepID=UPI002E108994|nr:MULTISPECIES: hypothetical protein [unclassified Kitasatospora]WSJ65467.1 zf-HC2 domain-containing protein [Kitasatospora sp. NBC_01302]